MFYARTPLIRSACVIAAAASVVVMSASLGSGAQQSARPRRRRRTTRAAAGSESAPPGQLRRAARRHAVGHRRDVPARPVVLARDLADQSAGREPAFDLSRATCCRSRISTTAGPSSTSSAAPRSPAAAESIACRRACASSRSRKRSRRFRTRRSRRSCRAPSCSTRTSSTTLPYVFKHREGLIASSGRDVYARGTDAPVGSVFNLVHLGDELVDPDDNDVLGYQGIFVGQGRVDRSGDPSTVRVLDSTRETLVGDYLLAEEDVAAGEFLPAPAGARRRRPDHLGDGRRIVDRSVPSRRVESRRRARARPRRGAARVQDGPSRDATKCAERAFSKRKCACRTNLRAR